MILVPFELIADGKNGAALKYNDMILMVTNEELDSFKRISGDSVSSFDPEFVTGLVIDAIDKLHSIRAELLDAFYDAPDPRDSIDARKSEIRWEPGDEFVRPMFSSEATQQPGSRRPTGSTAGASGGDTAATAALQPLPTGPTHTPTPQATPAPSNVLEQQLIEHHMHRLESESGDGSGADDAELLKSLGVHTPADEPENPFFKVNDSAGRDGSDLNISEVRKLVQVYGTSDRETAMAIAERISRASSRRLISLKGEIPLELRTMIVSTILSKGSEKTSFVPADLGAFLDEQVSPSILSSKFKERNRAAVVNEEMEDGAIDTVNALMRTKSTGSTLSRASSLVKK